MAGGNGGAGPELAHIPAARAESGEWVFALSLQYQTSGYPGPHRLSAAPTWHKSERVQGTLDRSLQEGPGPAVPSGNLLKILIQMLLIPTDLLPGVKGLFSPLSQILDGIYQSDEWKGVFISVIICLFLFVDKVFFHRLVGHFYFFFVDFLFLSTCSLKQLFCLHCFINSCLLFVNFS